MLSPTRTPTHRAVTLIELMVVIALLSMLFGAGVALLRNLNRQPEVLANKANINALIRRARSTALSQSTRVELGFGHEAVDAHAVGHVQLARVAVH